VIVRISIFLLLNLLTSSAKDLEVEDGDIIFQRSQSRQAKAIAAATQSDYTHMGIIFFDNNQPFVYEAIQPVVRTPLQSWIQRGVGHHYVVKRLRDTSKVNFPKLKKEVRRNLGKDYDWLFEWSDDRIYCSELVWKAYQKTAGIKIGTLGKLRDFQLDHPSVRQIMRERYGKKIPLEMQVIAPSVMFDSSELITVRKK